MRKETTLPKKLCIAFTGAALTGCGSMGGVVSRDVSSPLSSVTKTNKDICTGFLDTQKKAAEIPTGTLKAEVLKNFSVETDDVLRHLTKSEINTALYGQSQMHIPFEQREEAQSFLNSLEGLSLSCTDVRTDKSFGLTASYTNKSGYEYNITFIFKEDDKGEKKLYDPVRVNGAPVKEKSSNGYLNSLNPVKLIPGMQ